MGLTEMRREFARIYAAQPRGQKSAPKAAIAAGYKDGPAIDVTASKLLRVPEVKAEILKYDPGDDTFPVTTHVDAAWMLSELAELWSTDVLELFDEHGNVKPLDEMTPQARKLIGGLEIQETLRGTRVKVRLLDRLKILEQIGKHREVMAFGETSSSEVDKSLAKLLDAATELVEARTPERAIDVQGATVDEE